jgi:PEP-CTERM motif
MKMKLSTFKKSVIAAALVAGVSAVAPASAGTLAQATLQVTGLTFQNAGTHTILDASNFTTLAITDSTNLNPSLNGVNNGHTFQTNGGVPLGFNQQCVASSCPSFLAPGLATVFNNAAIPAAGSGSIAASNLVGAPITGLGVVTTPATAQTAALSELTATGFADSASVLRLQTAFTFSLAQSTSVLLDFNTIVHVIDNLNSGTGSAQSSTAWTINIVDANGVQVFNWTPDGVLGTGFSSTLGGAEVADGCNMQATRGLLGVVGTASFDCSGHEAATTGTLLANTNYTLTLRHETDSSVTLLVPEPETVLLMGLGLAGLALSQRRKARKA